MSGRIGIKVTRGAESWQFIYTILGFALTIEAGVVALIEPLQWPWNLIAYVVTALVTTYLFLDNGWFQNGLIGWKARYEGKER